MKNDKLTRKDALYFDSPEQLSSAVEEEIKKTEVAADIGCGIVPMNYFRPKLHILIEPWKEYADILSYRHGGDKSVLILKVGALEALCALADNSVDSIFLLDVIEHLERDLGEKVIVECERVAREQIVIFTPLGFMPQHVEIGQQDGWGLSGAVMQEHRSGWLPEDFSSAWKFYICENFHRVDFKGQPLDKVYGAFYAIRNFEDKATTQPDKLTDFRRQLPSEKLILELGADYNNLLEEYQRTRQAQEKILADFQQLQLDYQNLLNEHH